MAMRLSQSVNLPAESALQQVRLDTLFSKIEATTQQLHVDPEASPALLALTTEAIAICEELFNTLLMAVCFFYRAQAYRYGGDSQASIKACEESLQILYQPNSDPSRLPYLKLALTLMMQLLCEQEDLASESPKVNKCMEELLKYFGDDPQVLIEVRTKRCTRRLNLWDQQWADFENMELREEAAQLLKDMNDLDEPVKQLAFHVDRIQSYLDLHANKLRLHLLLGEMDDVIQSQRDCLQFLTRENPEDVMALVTNTLVLAMLLAEDGLVTEAEAIYVQCKDQLNELTQAHPSLRDLYSLGLMAWVNLIAGQKKSGINDEAKDAIVQACQIDVVSTVIPASFLESTQFTVLKCRASEKDGTAELLIRPKNNKRTNDPQCPMDSMVVINLLDRDFKPIRPPQYKELTSKVLLSHKGERAFEITWDDLTPGPDFYIAHLQLFRHSSMKRSIANFYQPIVVRDRRPTGASDGSSSSDRLNSSSAASNWKLAVVGASIGLLVIGSVYLWKNSE